LSGASTRPLRCALRLALRARSEPALATHQLRWCRAAPGVSAPTWSRTPSTIIPRSPASARL